MNFCITILRVYVPPQQFTRPANRLNNSLSITYIQHEILNSKRTFSSQRLGKPARWPSGATCPHETLESFTSKGQTTLCILLDASSASMSWAWRGLCHPLLPPTGPNSRPKKSWQVWGGTGAMSSLWWSTRAISVFQQPYLSPGRMNR